MEMKITITIDDGKIKDVKVDKFENEIKSSENTFSIYARCFDAGNPNWEKSPEMNLLFLKQTQVYMTDLLKSKGYLFLNDVYDKLGMPKTKTGQMVGWIYDEKNTIGDNYVDFGIFSDNNARSVNGYENSIWLDFNVDGVIWDLLP